MILNVKKTEKKYMKEEKQSYRRQSGCEAAYKMKKSGMREVLVWEKMKKIKTK